MTHTPTVSRHAVLVYLAVSASPAWMTHQAISLAAPTVAPRTVRHHVGLFLKANLLERAETFPELRFRWTGKNRAGVKRLEDAALAFGLKKV